MNMRNFEVLVLHLIYKNLRDHYYRRAKDFVYLFFISILPSLGFTQSSYLVKGKVVDAETGEPIPYANVYTLPNTQQGTVTNLEGEYTLRINSPSDSLVASYVSYIPLAKAIQLNTSEQTIDFALTAANQQLEEFVFIAGEDPAYPIMRKVIKNKKNNDRRKLDFYEYDSYIKIELFLNNLPEKLDNRKIYKRVLAKLDSIGERQDEDGNKMIPIMISEATSKHYHQNHPERAKDKILKHKITGLGVHRGRYTAQLTGSKFHDYNFYKNWISIFTKDFISPISDNWRIYYDYYLVDSMHIGKHWCYKIDMEPKRPQDLAFNGSIWIDSETYALKKIDAKVDRGANINFIDGIEIHQELAQTASGSWIPAYVQMTLDVTQITKSSVGLIGKFYVTNRDFVLESPRPASFFEEDFELDQEAYIYKTGYWDDMRPDSISTTEEQTYAMIDSLREVKGVKQWTDVFSTLVSGYKTVGKIDLGHILNTYANNDVEGHRLEIGFRTNTDFSTKYILKGFLAYGTEDRRLKYSASFNYLHSRKNWTLFGITRSENIARIGVSGDDFKINPLISTILRWGNLRSQGPYRREEINIFAQTDIVKGFTQKVQLRKYEFQPILDNFAFFTEPNNPDSPIATGFTNADIVFETRLSRKETYIYPGNNRFSLGTEKLPILTFRYTLGLKNFLNSDFNYHKFELNLEQDLRTGVLGRTRYQVSAGYTPSTLPVALLFVPVGNQGFVYNFRGFNVLDFLEFTSDRFLMLNLEHNFEGLIANRIPLLRKLKLRTVIMANAFIGDLSTANRNLSPGEDVIGRSVIQANPIGRRPYLEVGYGISNIFKFLQVGLVHRVTYRDRPGVRRLGFFVAGRLSL